MKLRWYDRLLVALSGLILLAIAVLIALVGCGTVTLPETLSIDAVRGGLRRTPLFMLVALLVAAWGVRLLVHPLRRAKDPRGKYFRVSGGESEDELTISVQALDHLVRRCVDQMPAVLAAAIRIQECDEGVKIHLRATLRSDVRIPETTAALQAQIRGYVQECAGMKVTGVQVVVDATRDVSGKRNQGATPLLAAGGVQPVEAESAEPVKDEPINEETIARPPAETVVEQETPTADAAFPDETVTPELVEPAETPTETGAVDMSQAPQAQAEEPPVDPAREAMEREARAEAEARAQLEETLGPAEPLPIELSTAAFPFPDTKDENEDA